MTSPKRSVSMRRRLLGKELLRLREVVELTQEAAGAHLGKRGNKISRVETGAIGIDKTDLDALLNLYKVGDKDRVWCRDLWEHSRVKRGRPTGETTLYLGPKWFRAFRDLEKDADEILLVGSEVVPGILQTDDYIRAMFAAQGVDPAEKQVDDTLRIRAERRLQLTDEDGGKFAFVMSESALRRQFGGPEVMLTQLRYLAEVSLLPSVTLQVIPFDAQSFAEMYDFIVFRFGHEAANDIAYIEMFSDAAYLDKPAETVRRYGEHFGRLQAIALGPVESRNFILGLANQPAA
ncbi:helix-turn-helix transcriptional regulator [Actinokineospora sp. NBRC 105648]|uniref:helix-turn-helix domain-containing protein n=1 Tax=Actinokineospora sp. NBRC 105648 TaxID=3032206 RepID=UPI0024A2AC94|nr:helix-turn-helix transcriptional regulator [Actinokineospora sp. NBRC 105648]GLZ41119.1 transcriptional regulator [Actinokineospora sp. NBRC 105648]